MNNKIAHLKIITIKTDDWNDGYWKSFTKNYNNIFNKNFTIDFFKKKYKSSSVGFSFHSLLINDLNEVVGACTVIPRLYYRNLETLKIGQAVDVFIIEKYRTNPMMLKDMYLELKEQLLLNEIICVLAVPNKNVFKYWTNVVKWKHIGDLNYWAHPIKIGSALNKGKILDKLSLLFSVFLGFLNNIFCKILYNNKNHDTYKIIQNDEFLKMRFNNKYKKTEIGFFKIYKEKEVEVAYIFPACNEPSLINLVKSIKIIREKTNAHLVFYVGTLFKFKYFLLKVPKKLEPQKLPLTCDILDKKNLQKYADMLEIKNWDFSLTNFDVR